MTRTKTLRMRCLDLYSGFQHRKCPNILSAQPLKKTVKYLRSDKHLKSFYGKEQHSHQKTKPSRRGVCSERFTYHDKRNNVNSKEFNENADPCVLNENRIILFVHKYLFFSHNNA